MIKLETIDDVYRLDYELSTPGVRAGLLANAENGGDDYEIIQDQDGTRGAFMRTNMGLYPLGALAPVQVAAAPVQTMTDAVPQGPEIKSYDPTTREQISAFLQSGLEGVGVDRVRARKISQSLIGGPSSGAPLSLGIADIVPFLGTALQTEEAVRLGQDAAQLAEQGRYTEAAVSAAGAAIGMIPGAVGTVQTTKKVAPMIKGSADAIAPPSPAMQAGSVKPSAFMPSQAAPAAEPQRSDIGFYSAVEKAVLDSKQDKGTGAQFLAQITKTQGVKPEELKWTGLDEFLKGKKSVTKQEIQDYLNANRVDVQEVRLEASTGQRIPLTNEEQARLNVLRERERAEGLGGLEAEEYSDLLNKEINFEEFYDKTKFSSYTLPGGENYREILLTLPQKTAPFDPSNVKIYRNRTSATQGTFTIKYGDNAVGPFADEFDISNDYAGLSDQQIMDVAKRMYEQGNELSGIKPMSGAFKSSHFDQPNILAHMRVNDRVVDGKKTLFIEEVQSDWHQAGRKKGYSESGKPFEVFDPRDGNVIARFATEKQAKKYADELGPQVDYGMSEGVPDAPFKTSWHELTLKRAIQEASEKGYDQIAFTTGKTQAERYDLSKQIDEINVVGRTNVLTGEKSKSIALDTVDGQSIRLGVSPDGTVDNVNNEDMTNLIGKNLDEVVGKELAKKIMEGGSQTISGEGLKVGGEGMAGFYDQILPKSLEKLGKKFNAKVGKTEMDGVEVWAMDITPKMRETVTKQGQPLFQIGVGGGAAAGAVTMQQPEEQM